MQEGSEGAEWGPPAQLSRGLSVVTINSGVPTATHSQYNAAFLNPGRTLAVGPLTQVELRAAVLGWLARGIARRAQQATHVCMVSCCCPWTAL